MIKTSNLITKICPLCKTPEAEHTLRDKARDYFLCRTCGLIFVPPEQFLSPEEEKSRYDLHQNSPDDPEYRRFLSRLFIPMQKHLVPQGQGLDFGSGPGPTLSVMFEEAGHSITLYDPFYAKAPSVLENQYDFVTATEVVEHLRSPREELDKLWACVKPGGLLGVMTSMIPDKKPFENWHYIRDLTHVGFFSRRTFEWLADQWGAEVIFADGDVTIFRKKTTSGK